ncbi:hypothetical protein [Caballeronia mineralivorans]|jgi:hypothetical protein|uniref:hypothetical protein n=1 Tax=Caballeronia mineralivorans TaxID=2010198 RepID=UPI0023F4355C|nr:hypothetical protein [Caballeronia mineralivorans]MDB5783239.1 hypothetical protein [Caballeronia mineralivorans]MEA3098755.1 hypothetical protein [Caballeronia mineralivorans]
MSATNFNDSTIPVPMPGLLGIADHSISQYAEFNESHTFADANPLIGLVTVASDTLKLYDNGTLIGSMVATKGTAGWTLPSLTNGAHNQCDASVATTFDVCLVLTDMCLPPVPAVSSRRGCRERRSFPDRFASFP